MLAFSSQPSVAEKIYDALGAQYDVAFDTTPGELASADNEAEKYSLAMHLARVELTLERAGNQRNVALATDLLPLRELDFKAVPGANDTIATRQARLSGIRALSLGATQSNIAGILQAALGSCFLKLRVVLPNEVWTDTPTSNFVTPGLPPTVVQLLAPVAITGTPVWVSYASPDPSVSETLIAGTTVTVQGENNALAEVVTIAGTQLASDGVTTQFMATFVNGHDVGATVTTGPFCRWTSSKAFLFVELTTSAASNPITRAQVDTLMAKLTRGVTQWATVAAVANAIGPNVIGTTPLGTATLGTTAA
jgi:hypothetical protein